MRRALHGLAALLTLGGCQSRVELPRPADAPAAEVPRCGAAFDPANVGAVSGRVVWRGPRPVVPPLSGAVASGEEFRPRAAEPNPFAPRVAAGSGGLGQVLVWLEGIDRARCPPLEVGPARELILGDYRFADAAVAVPVGTTLRFSSRDPEMHVVTARGAAFFALALPRPGDSAERKLAAPGVVELASGAGYNWVGCDVLVSPTPFSAATGVDGAFRFERVPVGSAELVVRVRDWRVARSERDPATGLVVRNVYRPAVVKRFPVAVTAAGASQVIEVGPADFAP